MQLYFLFSNSILLQLSNRLLIELPNLFSMPLPNKGLNGTSQYLVIVIGQGKTNQYSRLEYRAALYYRDYRSYLIGALAMYFFQRQYYSGEPFPYLYISQDQYNIKVLKRDNTHLAKPLSNSIASSQTRWLYSEASIKTSKVTYTGRVSGARLVELNGVLEDQICRGGYWNTDQIMGYYLTTLLYVFIRSITDFDPEQVLSYFLLRETIQPLALLLRRVQPNINYQQVVYLEQLDIIEQVEPNLAIGGFLELLQRLRVVFLQVRISRALRTGRANTLYYQDLVLQYIEFPRYPIF